jgi:hypothetical protein
LRGDEVAVYDIEPNESEDLFGNIYSIGKKSLTVVHVSTTTPVIQ